MGIEIKHEKNPIKTPRPINEIKLGLIIKKKSSKLKYVKVLH
jgi:hypothetical protein